METLLLSHGFEPLGRVCWERAVKLWSLDKIDIVEAYGRTIRSPSMRLKVPAVARFRYRVPTRRVTPMLSRRAVYERDDGRCQYCGKKLLFRESTWDHVHPRSRGGKSSWENLALACRRCNERKGARTPREAGMCLFQTPVMPRALPPVLGSLRGIDVPRAWQPYLWGRGASSCSPVGLGGSRSS